MAQQSYTQTVLDTALAIITTQAGEASTDMICNAMHTKTRQESKNCCNALSELYRTGRLGRVRQGVYGPPTAVAKNPLKCEVMWRLLRMQRRTADDMVELAGVSRDYALEWLGIMVKRGVVRKDGVPGRPAIYTMIKDSIEMPTDDEKAEKLRALRAKKKAELIAKISQIEKLVGEARTAIETIYQKKES